MKSKRLLAGRQPSAPQADPRTRILAVMELGTGVMAVVGGALLAAAPDGSLLRADPKALTGSPFTDWRVPGVLLAALVGGGFLLAASWQWRNRWHARELSILAGAGLIAFEAAEVAWIGFQPLEAGFATVGVVVLLLAWRGRTASPARPPPRQGRDQGRETGRRNHAA